MTQNYYRQYRLNVRFTPGAPPARRRRARSSALISSAAMFPQQKTTSRDTAIRGILIGAPIALLLWAPIVWGLSHIV